MPPATSASDTLPPGTRIETVSEESDPGEIRLSVVVPTFNESGSIRRALSRLYGTNPLDEEAIEVIVVDESTDDTPDIVRSLDYPNLRLVRFDGRKGLAGSVIEGFKMSNGTYLGVIDADGQHPPAKLFELFETAIEHDHDLVVASRYAPGGGIENWRWYRKLISWGATLIADLLLLRDVDISDPMSGFFVVRRATIEDVTLDPVGYKILLEILVRGNVNSIEEVGYVFADREHGETNLGYEEYVNYLRHVGSLLWHDLTG
ncbi:MAG: polyprenol monophosphomannose synthase [Halobacteriales archaeon]